MVVVYFLMPSWNHLARIHGRQILEQQRHLHVFIKTYKTKTSKPTRTPRQTQRAITCRFIHRWLVIRRRSGVPAARSSGRVLCVARQGPARRGKARPTARGPPGLPKALSPDSLVERVFASPGVVSPSRQAPGRRGLVTRNAAKAWKKTRTKKEEKTEQAKAN